MSTTTLELKENKESVINPEKVELSFVNDDALQKTKPSDNNKDTETFEFKVQQNQTKSKKKKKNNINSSIDVFTGSSSPIKPKLRSTMNELMKQKEPSEILPRLEYGIETLIKLPWPVDTNEDAAWVSGHHLCFTIPTELDVPNFCFLCGSAGKAKVN